MSTEKKELNIGDGLSISFDEIGLDFGHHNFRDYYTLRQFFDALGINLDDCKRAFGEPTKEENTDVESTRT